MDPELGESVTNRWGVDLAAFHHRYRHDPRFAAEMDYCYSHGIPHSEFLSWPTGDQDLVIAMAIHRAESCPRCGTSPRDWPNERDEPLTAEFVTCFACRLIEDAEGEVPDEARGETRIRLVPTEYADALEPRRHVDDDDD